MSVLICRTKLYDFCGTLYVNILSLIFLLQILKVRPRFNIVIYIDVYKFFTVETDGRNYRQKRLNGYGGILLVEAGGSNKKMR